MISYLLEQKQYSGTDLDMAALMWSGIYLHANDQKARSIPVFALTQRTGAMYPEESFRKNRGNSFFFGVESAVYWARAILEVESLKRQAFVREPAIKATKYSIDWCSEGVGRIEYTEYPDSRLVDGEKPKDWIFKFYHMLNYQRAQLLSFNVDSDESEKELEQIAKESILPTTRHQGQRALGFKHARSGNSVEAVKAFEAVVRNEVGFPSQMRGIWDLIISGDAYRVEGAFDKARELINELKERPDIAGSEDKKKHLISTEQKLMEVIERRRK